LRRWRLAVAALVAALALLPLPARPLAAQADVRLASLSVSLWPEFDQPATLVILDGQLDPAVALPASLSMRIPARAGQPHAVAVTDASGQLVTAAYTTQPAGDDIIVMFPTQSPGFRLEYYDPALTIDNDARQFAFDWQTDYAIAAAVVRVQQPAGARDLAGDPALTALGAGEDGLNYHAATWGALAPGERLTLRLSYAKTGTALTAQSQGGGVQPQAAVPAAPAPAPGSLPWIVGGVALGLAAAAAGVYIYKRAQRPIPARAAHRARRRAGPAQRTRPAPAGFCTQCGQARVAGDQFCRQCGARLPAS
jgi:hypothetical protein